MVSALLSIVRRLLPQRDGGLHSVGIRAVGMMPSRGILDRLRIRWQEKSMPGDCTVAPGRMHLRLSCRAWSTHAPGFGERSQSLLPLKEASLKYALASSHAPVGWANNAIWMQMTCRPFVIHSGLRGRRQP